MKILESKVKAAADQSHGAEIPMYDWVSKVALDIICISAFDYETDSLHNPHNELAEAYEKMINLQSGNTFISSLNTHCSPTIRLGHNMAKMIFLMHCIPGFPR